MRKTWKWGVALIGLGVAGVTGPGCGDNRPAVSTSSKKVKVSGTVLVDGKPLVGGGKISFNPANIERRDAPVAVAEIDKDGKYSAETLVGWNQVGVDSPKLPRMLGSNYEVKDGENPYDPDLKTTGR